MSLSNEERKIVVGLETEKARNTFAEIEVLRQAGLWDNIANRLYYAAFHAVSALLINDGHIVGTHQGAVKCYTSIISKLAYLKRNMALSTPDFRQ